MNGQTSQYKGYTALITYAPEDNHYSGKVIGIKHKILFHGSTIEETLTNFKEMIDEYPDACAANGLEPNQPPKEIMVPFPTELYAQAYDEAENTGIPVQQYMHKIVQQSIT